MTIIAQITDLHLLEAEHVRRTGIERGRLAFLSAGAPLDAARRKKSALAALLAARRAGADHIVISGDLTEDGHPAQFELLAEVLHGSGIDPEQITLVPGNHDAYGEPGSYEAALAGPLAAFRTTSADGAFSVLDEAVIKPISTVIEGQTVMRAGGAVRPSDVERIHALASDHVSRGRALVVVAHHPPMRHAFFGFEWFDGVHNAEPLKELLLERSRVHVVHGHMHKRLTQRLCAREHAQVFAAESVRDSDNTLRLYKAQDGVLFELAAPNTIAAPVPLPLTAAAAMPLHA